MNGSVTTSGRDRPNLPSTSAIWRTAPPPTSSMRGAAMLALTAVMALSSSVAVVLDHSPQSREEPKVRALAHGQVG